MRPDDFDHLVQVIYAGACDDGSLRQALRLLASLHRCTSAALLYTDRRLPGTDIALTYGPFSDPEIRARYQLYAADDPAPQAMARLPVGEAAATNRLFTQEALDRSRFLHEFYRPLGFEEALGGPVAVTDGRTGIVAIHRGPGREPFTDDEIAGFGRLLPHFGQALALRRAFFTLAERDGALSAALESTTQGVLIVDPQGELRHANARARTILGRNDGLSLSRSGHLRLGDVEAERHLFGRLGDPRPARAPTVLRVRRGNGARPYLLRLMRGRADPFEARPRLATLYVSDPEAETAAQDGIVASALGLSPHASALVASLIEGGDLASHAVAAGISRNTAKFHLQAAFAATGTSRQVDLVRVVEGILRDLGQVPTGEAGTAERRLSGAGRSPMGRKLPTPSS